MRRVRELLVIDGSGEGGELWRAFGAGQELLGAVMFGQHPKRQHGKSTRTAAATN